MVEIDRILIRGIWYTPIDVTSVDDVEAPAKLQRGPGEVRARTPFDDWCHKHFTNESSGTALLATGRSKELEVLLGAQAIHVPYLKTEADEPSDAPKDRVSRFGN